jgi:hypothetical protein
MKIINDRRKQDLWLTAIIEGRLVSAKVYDEPSEFGINDGRVSKLSICKGDKFENDLTYFQQLDYHYDRGLDINRFDMRKKKDKTLFNNILNELENLPKAFA